MNSPLLVVWPWWPAFWIVFFWAYFPESRIVRKAQKAASQAGSLDSGSTRVIVMSMWIAMLLAFAVAYVGWLRFPAALVPVAYVIGIALVIAGSLLRRHCRRLLGASFTGDVRARPDQALVTTGAYARLRHPSYTGGILMNLGLGLALGTWVATAVLVIASLVAYIHRINVEERTLLAVIGEPYRQFIRTRWRLVPYVY